MTLALNQPSWRLILPPFRIGTSDQGSFLSFSPAFDLLLAENSIFHIFILFIIDKLVCAMYFGEARKDTIFMFMNSSKNVVRNTDVSYARVIGHDIDEVRTAILIFNHFRSISYGASGIPRRACGPRSE